MNLPPLIIQEHAGFSVVRGDLYTGGIKCRVLTELLSTEIGEKNIIYAACYYGHSGFALGMAGLYTGKSITLFMTAPEEDTYIHQQVKTLSNVTCIQMSAENQREVAKHAEQVAKATGSYYLPVGFLYEPFKQIYIRNILKLGIQPKEVWVTGGSGVSAQCLKLAWPQAKVRVINLGVRPTSDLGLGEIHYGDVWKIEEKIWQESKDPPPWPSARYYDAKMWQIVREHAKPGALIWNIA